MCISRYVSVIKACQQDVLRMYEKSRLQGGTKSVDVEDGRKELGMRSLNSLEDPTKKGGW